jgi:tetratricopeptide (TPR) repeat protein
MERNNLILSLFGIYNYISSLTKNYNSERNKNKKEEILNKIKENSNMIIQYTILHFADNDLNSIFNLNYIKDLIIKTYFSFLNTFYLSKKNKDLESEFKKYENFIEIYNVSKNINNGLVYKLKGDYYYTIKNFDLAVKNYLEGLNLIKNNQNKIKLKADIMFNLGLSYILLTKTTDAKNIFKKCSEIYELQIFNNPTAEDEDKKKMIQEIINKLGD